jgi:hypothetical protein
MPGAYQEWIHTLDELLVFFSAREVKELSVAAVVKLLYQLYSRCTSLYSMSFARPYLMKSSV